MTVKLYQTIAADLQRELDAGVWKPGDRLPPERVLATRFGVSRTSLREALLALEFAGRLEIRDRAGVYVREPEATVALPAFADLPGPYEVLEARRLIEGEATYRTALRASHAELAVIVDAARRLAAIDQNDLVTFQRIDRAFHVHIAHACGNSVLAELVVALWDQRDGPLWKSWYEGTRSTENRTRSSQQHLEIAAFLEARQAQPARAAMERHIDTIIERFLRYGAEATDADPMVAPRTKAKASG